MKEDTRIFIGFFLGLARGLSRKDMYEQSVEYKPSRQRYGSLPAVSVNHMHHTDPHLHQDAEDPDSTYLWIYTAHTHVPGCEISGERHPDAEVAEDDGEVRQYNQRP